MILLRSGTDHSIGTCTMGKVVDSSLRVVEMDNLRVIDASSRLPFSLTSSPPRSRLQHLPVNMFERHRP